MKNTKSYLKLLNDIQEEIPSFETLDIKDERKKIKSELIRKKQKRHIFSDNSKIDLIYSDFSSDSKKRLILILMILVLMILSIDYLTN